MPIEIQEIHIRVNVAGPGQSGSTGTPAGATAGAPSDAGAAHADRQAIVAECVERVLQILRDREEP